jgi:hypothetical protein
MASVVRRSLGPTLGPSGAPFRSSLSRKLRWVNEIIDGYEPGGRRFESGSATFLIEGLRPSNSPTRSLAGPLTAPLGSRGSLAVLVRANTSLIASGSESCQP